MYFLIHYQDGSGKDSSRKHFKNYIKKSAVKLCRTDFHLSTKRRQLTISKLTMRRVWALAKEYPINPIIPRESMSGRRRKTRRVIRQKLQRKISLAAVKLKRAIPALF